MLKKQEEKKEKFKDEAYYAMKIKKLTRKLKNLSLVAQIFHEDEGTYQIWSSGSYDKDMCHMSHGVMFVKHQCDQLDGKMVFKEFFDRSEGESDEDEDICDIPNFPSRKRPFLFMLI